MATATATVTKRRGRKRRGNPLAGFDATIDEKTALDQYLRDVSRHELITPDREKELGARALQGDNRTAKSCCQQGHPQQILRIRTEKWIKLGRHVAGADDLQSRSENTCRRRRDDQQRDQAAKPDRDYRVRTNVIQIGRTAPARFDGRGMKK